MKEKKKPASRNDSGAGQTISSRAGGYMVILSEFQLDSKKEAHSGHRHGQVSPVQSATIHTEANGSRSLTLHSTFLQFLIVAGLKVSHGKSIGLALSEVRT